MWILLSLAAGTLQTIRNGFAKELSGEIPPTLNSWGRFAFNLPWAFSVVVWLALLFGLPTLSAEFMLYCAVAGMGQLLGNTALVAAFERANFAQSIALHKLEVVFAAVIGAVVLGEVPSLWGWGGVALCTLGTLAINLGRSSGPEGWRRAFHIDLGSALAMLCGLLFVVAAFAVKGAVEELALVNPNWEAAPFAIPAHTLFHVTWMEVAVLTTVLAVRDRAALGRVREVWRPMVAIGATSYASSLCWFWAFSLTLVAYVRVVGQIEAVLSVLLAIVWWKEREAVRQMPGVALVIAGILLLLMP